MEENKAGNLPPERVEDTMDDLDQFLLLQFSQDAERRRLGTPWFLTQGGYTRVTVAIVGPKVQCPQGELPLSRRQAEYALQAIANLVSAFKEELR
jgi:hypothetical protein